MILFFAPVTKAQESKITSLEGVVIDAETGERLPFVQVYFVKPDGTTPSQFGTTSDLDGGFAVSNAAGYTTVHCQMVGFKTEVVSLRVGQQKKNVKVKLKPDVYGLQDIIVRPDKQKNKYKRKGNPAVELVKNVIAHKDSFQVKSADHYVAQTYHRMSFAIDNFNPNFQKGFWKSVSFIDKYIDRTGENPALTVSIREHMSHENYQRRPHREKTTLNHARAFGLESLLSVEAIEENMKAVFTDVDINDDNMNLLFNRFVSPLSSSLAVSYYQYYIMDTILMDGDSVIDLAFVPVNSESYSFTGHLYIVNDSTFKVKKYKMNVPPHINLNFVNNYSVEHNYKRLENGLWAPDRTNTCATFALTAAGKRTIIARQTKLYTDFDLESPLPDNAFSRALRADTVYTPDTVSIRADFQFWDENRPEPLTFYESSVMDLLAELKATPKFNSLMMAADAMMSEYVPTVPSTRWGESKWDFGPIYNTISWNKLEGVRLRVGGTTTANLHRQLFLTGYVAFGTTDLRPKYKTELMWSFNKKWYHQYESPRDYLAASVMYDVEEPGQELGFFSRDHIINSIPTGAISDGYLQYVFRTRVRYLKDFPNYLTFRANLDYEYNEAAGAMRYDRITSIDSLGYIQSQEQCFDQYHRNAFHSYEGFFELRYAPGANYPVNRNGVESVIMLNRDAPILTLSHRIGYLDDRWMLDSKGEGGKGWFYNYTEFKVSKRFWFSSFGHLDTRLQAGYIWNQVPFTKLYTPATNTSILLGKGTFNQMQPSEFMFDAYVSLYATYYFKGWILNRIPGINRLKLRGVVSFAGIYGALLDKNNPFLPGHEGMYAFPNDLERITFDQHEANIVTAGHTSSPIGKLPYMEITAGLENIFHVLRIDYVRRLTYNDYELPFKVPVTVTDENGDATTQMVPARRRIGAWGRNGVKLTLHFEF